MADVQWQVGDEVQLMSGGPVMTVVEAGPDMFQKVVVTCSWFIATKLEHGNFPPGALKRYEAPRAQVMGGGIKRRGF